jgi:hypothetical protein
MPSLIHSQVVVPFGQGDIATEEHGPLTLEDAPQVFPGFDTLGPNSNLIEAAYQISEMLRGRCELQGSHEHLFLLLYFDRVIESLNAGSTLRDALLPLPKARFSLVGESSAITTDFAFWTGRRFVTVFIQESCFGQDLSVEERLLKLWGLEVFRLMADQLETHGLKGEIGAKLFDALSSTADHPR